MERAEKEARRIFGTFGRMPRKKKKVAKKAIKRFVKTEIDNGNWDLMNSMFTFGLWPKDKENDSYGKIDFFDG